MAEKTPKWNNTCERFVAFLDIMGFKDLMFRNDHGQVYELLNSFVSKINAIERVAKKRLSRGKATSDRDENITFRLFRSRPWRYRNAEWKNRCPILSGPGRKRRGNDYWIRPPSFGTQCRFRERDPLPQHRTG